MNRTYSDVLEALQHVEVVHVGVGGAAVPLHVLRAGRVQCQAHRAIRADTRLPKVGLCPRDAGREGLEPRFLQMHTKLFLSTFFNFSLFNYFNEYSFHYVIQGPSLNLFIFDSYQQLRQEVEKLQK